MAQPRKSPEEKIAELEQQEARIKARLQREKAKLRETERKADTRRKIIAGAIALEHAAQNPTFQKEFWDLLDRAVKKADQRQVLGLPPLPSGTTAK
jgi:hypothetical protein